MTCRSLRRFLPAIMLASTVLCSSAYAAEYVSVAKAGINLRSAPNTNASVLFELPEGYPLEVIGREGQWLKVSDYEGDKGYITESLVTKTPHVIVKAKVCNVRKGPNSKEPIVGNGVKDVIFLKGEQKGEWIKVTHPAVSGWVQKSLVWP